MSFYAYFTDSKTFDLGDDGVTDNVQFFVQASVNISIGYNTSPIEVFGYDQADLAFPELNGLVFMYSDDTGTHTRIVDAWPQQPEMVQDVGSNLQLSFFGCWAFTPIGNNAQLEVAFYTGITSNTDLDTDPLSDTTWTGSVMVLPEATETT